MALPWYTVNGINEIDSPALLIYKDRVQHNIDQAIKLVADPLKLRPHVKTHKSPQATMMMMQAGITKFKCATVAEAEMLAQCGAADVLVAYQPTGPKIGRLLALIQQYPATRFSCLVDSMNVVRAIAKETENPNLNVNVFLDVNIGMNRTGVTLQNTPELFACCRELRGINVLGIHGYDGHINDSDVLIRKQRADDAYNKLISVRDALQAMGMVQSVLIISGSPTFGIHAQRKDVECSPGTFVYWDKSYHDMFPDLEFLPAAVVVSRVVSVINKTTICLDLGHKSIASENPLNRRVYFLNAEDLIPVSHSEEHLVMETSTPHHYNVGDVLYGIPYHVCPTCALYDTAYVIKDGQVKEEWKMIARNRKILI
jgi:D-threonine aldolase